MPKTTLRQFTGGISNEIDPQNLREDQGEEALDINLKGFALEPGEVTDPISSGGHYYYRGEWIRDSKAVSFEESGIGVIKTYDDKRPEFEEIIKDDVNVSRRLGPPLPPSAVITGTVVSEGTRGERPAEGSHLLKVPETALGEVDKVVDGSAPSLDTHQADATTEINDIHYYDGQPFWVVRSSSTSWLIRTRQWSTVNGIKTYLSTYINSSPLTHFSKGGFFKEGFFVCWDNQYIETVPLSSSSMSIESLNTIDSADNGDAGAQGFIDNAGKTASSNFTTGATSNEITGVDINNGIVSFSQRITTANTLPTENTTSAPVATERWLRMPTQKKYVTGGIWGTGCFVVLLRDGQPASGSEATTGAVASADDDGVEVWTDKNKDVFPGWTEAKSKFEYLGAGKYNSSTETTSYTVDWASPSVNGQLQGYGEQDLGFKYGVVHAKNDTWVRVLYKGAKLPEIIVLENAVGDSSKTGEQWAKETTVKASIESYRNITRDRWNQHTGWPQSDGADFIVYYKDYINYELFFPSIKIVKEGNKHLTDNRIHWRFTAPVGTPNDSANAHGGGRDWASNTYGGRTNDHWGPTSLAAKLGCSSFSRYYYRKGWPNGAANAAVYIWTKRPRVFFYGTWHSSSSWSPTPVDVVGTHLSPYANNSGSWTRYVGGFRVNRTWQFRSIKSTAPGFKNVITATGTTPAVPGKMHRLCSYTPGGTVTQQNDFGVSELWTTATIRKPVDGEVGGGTIDFAEAGTLNFRKGDYIKVSQNGSGNGLHLNLPGKAYTSRTWLQINSNIQRRYVEQTFFTAQILKIEGTKLHLSAPEFDFHGTGKYLDEVCYPKISSYIEYSKWSGIRTVDTDGPECKVFKSDLSLNVLIGHGRGRHFLDSGKDGEFMEVRPAGGEAISSATARNYTHLIDWKTSYWSNNVIIYKDKDIRAVNAAVSPYDPRIFYVRSNRLYSQDGSDNTAPGILSLSANGKYYADKNYVTYVDNKDLTIFSTDLQNAIFYKGRPKLASGLGLTGEVTDARTYVTSTNAVYVLAQIGGYWKLVKTSNTKPEVSLLSYDFKKPIAFDGSRAWGIGSLATGGWDIQTVIPFYESNIIGSWIFYANDYTSLIPSISAWGEVVKSRLGASDDDGTPRYLSIDWKMDSGNWFVTGTPTIGLNDDSGKMVNENTFKWYPRDIPSTLVTSSTGTVISNIANNTYSPVAELEISFKSKVIRDIVFFKQAEGNSLPAANSTGSENQLAFINYQDANQAFYVINNNAFEIAKEAGKEPEWAYKLAQSDLSSSAFDASKVGVSSFLIGAPNMFNPYGPQIDFYYMASFINKWGLESAPSPLPSKGVTPLDSADDCIQINFSAPFFRLTDTDTETIRIYRYGGDSSEFLFLRDIPMPKLPEVAGVKSFPVISGFNNPVAGVKGGGSFARKSSTSPYYLLKTNYNISSLGEFINSNFDFVTTPTSPSATSLDGSWRINQLSENPSASVSALHQNELATELTASAIEIVTSTSNAIGAWPTSGVVKIDDEYISYTGITHPKITGCTRGIYNSNAAIHKIEKSNGAPTQVTVVEWVLEMEHRNQDTSELKIGIDTALTGSSNVITVASGGTSVFPASGNIMIGSEIFSYASKTTSTFVGVSHSSGSNNTHLIGALVRSYNETYTTTDLTNTSISIDGYGYRDKSRTPIASLYTIQKDNWPPLGLEYNETKKQFFETEAQDDYFRYIKAVGSMHFGALDGNLRFSKYGTPEYWPLEAVLTLDSEIRWIEEHGGEGIVFTTNSVYRVRGTDPKAMVAFRIPDAKGIPAGYEHTVASFNGGLLWLTAGDGIAMYHAGKVTYLTRDKHSISQLKFPYACSLDGVYWLFQRLGGGTGYRLEVISGEIRLGQTSVEAYYAYFAKALGIATVVTKDNIVNTDDTEFIVEELGGAKAKNITWKSKKIDAGEPTIPKALGSIEIVYEALSSSKSTTIENGIRGQALAAELLGLNPEDLDAGDINSNESESVSDLYDIFTKYDQPNQAFIIDTGGDNLTNTQRRTIIMPVGFDTSTVTVGDRIWNGFLSDNTIVESLTTETISSVIFPAIVLNKEPLRTGSGVIYWGNLPLVEIYINDDTTASRIFTLPPSTGEVVEAQSMDLYLNDLRRFRTISVAIQGDVRVQALSLTHYPLQRYQSQTLHHSADVFYRGDIDFRVMLDGDLIYRKNLSNDGDDFKEERVYLPASSFGQRAHYMNESRTGMIESVNFNGSVAA